MKRVNMYITSKNDRDLDDLSQALRVKRSKIVRRSIEEFKDKHEVELEEFRDGLVDDFSSPFYDSPEQEFVETCKGNKLFFMHNALKIVTYDKGLVDFSPYVHQAKIVELFETHNQVIINKSRQIGITTLMAADILHYAMFNSRKKIFIGSFKLEYTQEIIRIIRIMIENLPSYMTPKLSVKTKTCLEFAETKSVIKMGAINAVTFQRDKFDYLYLDEAAFIQRKSMDDFLDYMYAGNRDPRIIIASSPKGFNTFCKIWHDAMCNYNNFRPVEIPYTVMPNRDDKWASEEIQRIGSDRFEGEYKCKFVERGKYAL
jgi:predicted transcriptional regulator